MTDAFTPERIAQLREILARATSGPLQTQHDYNREGRTTIIGNVDGEYVDGKLDASYDFVCSTLNYGETDDPAKAKANTAAIVAAVNTLPAALDEIERLQEVNEELERNAEIVSADFEKDCWRALRKLLEMTGYDFTDEGVTADEAFEHLADDIKAGNAQLKLISDERNRIKTELDEAVAEVKRLRGTLEYIKAQSVSKAYASTPAMALNVIRANAEAALDDDFQSTVAEAHSFLSRMERPEGWVISVTAEHADTTPMPT